MKCFTSLAFIMMLSVLGIHAQEVDKKDTSTTNPWEQEFQKYKKQKDSTQASEFDKLDKELEKYYENEREWLHHTLGIKREDIPAKATPKSISELENKKAKEFTIDSKKSEERVKATLEAAKSEFVPSICPIRGKYRISSPYGWRQHPIYKKKLFHSGLDMAAAKGTDVVATASGKVLFAGTNKGYGKYIIIQHTDGVKTAYAHLNKILVKKGQTVEKGDLIAYVGTSGNSTGPHLHYEVIVDNKKLNPADFFKK